MQTRFEGRVWLFGDDISTDHIIAGRYLGSMDPKSLAEHAMEAVDPDFTKKVQLGDLIVGGTNFGCGSSREQAVVALRGVGVSCIVANTFARIFYRNAINVGFPVIECPGLHDKLNEGDRILVDLEAGSVMLPSGVSVPFQPIPPNLLDILRAGGLVPKLKAELGSRTG